MRNTLLLSLAGFFPAFVLLILAGGLFELTEPAIGVAFVQLLVLHGFAVTLGKFGLDSILFAKARESQLHYLLKLNQALKVFIVATTFYTIFYLTSYRQLDPVAMILSTAAGVDALATVLASSLVACRKYFNYCIVNVTLYGTLLVSLLINNAMGGREPSLETISAIFLVGALAKLAMCYAVNAGLSDSDRVYYTITRREVQTTLQQVGNFAVFKCDQLYAILIASVIAPNILAAYVFFSKVTDILTSGAVALNPLIYEVVGRVVSKRFLLIFLLLVVSMTTFITLSAIKEFMGFDVPLELLFVYSSIFPLSIVINNIVIRRLGNGGVTKVIISQLVASLAIITIGYLAWVTDHQYHSLYMILPGALILKVCYLLHSKND